MRSRVGVCLLAFGVVVACSSHKALGPIATEYRNAGGGDPRTISGDTLVSWLTAHEPFAKQLKERCRQEMPQLDPATFSADSRVCDAAGFWAWEPVKGDGRKF